MERKKLESAAADYSYLRGLFYIPLGILFILAALGNWEWGPLRHAWVFIGAVLVLGAACLHITRYYNENYGRLTPSTRQQVRAALATIIGVAVMAGGSFLLRSQADWSLDLPVNPIAASFGLLMLAYYAITVGPESPPHDHLGRSRGGRPPAGLEWRGTEQRRSCPRGSGGNGDGRLRSPPVRSHLRVVGGSKPREQQCRNLTTS